MPANNITKRRFKKVIIRSPRRSSWSRKKTGFALLFLVLAAVVVCLSLRSGREKTARVTVTRISYQDLTSVVSASGEVKPKKNVNISAHVSGRIVKIGVEEGQAVKRGDFLLKLDSTQYEANADRDRAVIRTYKAELIKAEAQLKKDESFYQRQKKLFDSKLISRDQLEDAETQHDISKAQQEAILYQIKQAEASLQITLDMLAKTVYNSPIDGIITSLRVEEGEIAMIGTMNNPGTVLMTIADLSVMQVEVDVDETDVIGLKTGQPVKVRIDALPGQVIEGEVTEIGSSALRKSMASEESKDFEVTITLTDPLESLKPGLSASADIIIARKFHVLAVPISSVVQKNEASDGSPDSSGQEEGIFLVKNSRAQFQPVRTGIMGEMMIEILSGVAEGQEAITGPYSALRQLKNGMLIKIEQRKE